MTDSKTNLTERETKHIETGCRFFAASILQANRTILQNNRTVRPELVQYCNETMSLLHARDCLGVRYNLLDQDKKYINIGTGAGLLEYLCRNRGVPMDTVDYIAPDDYEYQPYFDMLRAHYGVGLTYESTDYYQGYDIPKCDRLYDEALLIRFGPWQKTLEDPALVDTMMSNLFNIAKRVTVMVGSLTKCHVRHLITNYNIVMQDHIRVQFRP